MRRPGIRPAIWVAAKGVKLSAAAVGVALVAQVAVELAVCVGALAGQRGHLSTVPFAWAHLTGGLTGLTGLSTGFPLALYMFHRLGERPGARRRVPRPATVTGFDYHVSSIGRSSCPA